MLAEMVISAGLLTMLICCFGAAQSALGRFNHHQLVRQQCIAAAAAQIQQFIATGKEIEPQQIKRLWPGVRIKLRHSPGQGAWAGLTLVEAVATGDSRGKEVRVELRRYARIKEASP
jgi:hypothetical protein